MKTISSHETDPKESHANFYGWIDIKGGKIIALHDELGREGGCFWRADMQHNGALKECMATIGQRWPNLYVKARELCPSHNLPSIETIKRNTILFEINNIKGEIEEYEARIRELRREQKRWEKRLK